MKTRIIAAPRVPKLSAKKARAEMTESDTVIVDIRPHEDYAQGHIEGAINISLETIPERAPHELPDKNKRIFVYCATGYYAATAVDLLRRMGYKNAVSIGGITQWPYEIVH